MIIPVLGCLFILNWGPPEWREHTQRQRGSEGIALEFSVRDSAATAHANVGRAHSSSVRLLYAPPDGRDYAVSSPMPLCDRCARAWVSWPRPRRRRRREGESIM